MNLIKNFTKYILFFGLSLCGYSQAIPLCGGGGNADGNVSNGILIDNGDCGEATLGTFSSAGNLEVKDGDLTLNLGNATFSGNIFVCDGCSLTINGGTVTITGNIENNGIMNLNGTSIVSNGSLVVKGSGSTNMNNSSFESTGGDINIESGGEIDMTNGSSLTTDSGNKIVNDGTITSDGSGNTVSTGNIEGSGTTPSELDCGDATCSDSPLPVDLLYFNAIAESEIKINWATATEINNDYFSIERSEDGVNYYEIGKVNGNGDSNQEITYSFTDKFVLAPVEYYRLKQVDFDGMYEHFQVKRVETNLEKKQVQILAYPTLVQNGKVNLSSTQSFQVQEITIYNLAGGESQNLSQHTIQENPLSYLVDLSGLTKGFYLLRLTTSDGNEFSTRLMVK
ncbi:T9SS type A sorting domain-containing protein [Ekhidna sp.]|uniref:T9SS type A sorting domain-containing protein n=1 Tax=Ekhidna sp. TaxID=2608089 RepID=UPI003C7C6AF7